VPNLRKRSVGLTVTATLFGALAVSGLLNAFVWSSVGESLPPDAPEGLRAGVKVLASPAFSAAAILYAITALCAAAGTWKMRAWASPAILVWGVSVFILAGIFATVTPQIWSVPFGIIIYAGLGVVAAAIVGVIWWYVRRETLRIAP
jgi:hypothetical protein